MSDTITLPDPPTTADFAVSVLGLMGAQSAVLTDFNKGSNIRTTVEAAGAVLETQGVTAQALAFQAIIYSCWEAFAIFPLASLPATGQVTFITGLGASPPPASQTVTIPQGTVVQAGSTQYVTTSNATLQAGATSALAPVVAVQPGSAGNTGPATVNLIASGLGYTLFVTNTSAIQGGMDAETPTQTMQRFTSKVLSLGLGSPVSIANACIGVSLPNGETVRYSTVYEGWISQAAGSQTAGFVVYIDNGSGTASPALLAAVTAMMNGSRAADALGERPAGVPFSVVAVTPVTATVVVTASLVSSSLQASLAATVTSAVQAYFASLQFGAAATYSGLNAAVANALAGYVTNLTVTLLDSTGTAQTAITPPPTGRMLLQNITNNLN